MYSYDNLGNITIVNRSGNLPVYYTYDAQNQLVSVLEGDFRYDFTYDTYGNILSVACVEDYTDEVLSSNTYSYDAWGKVTASGSIGQINPIRYRGYYYDTDTGFYYLQSRYYDPAISDPRRT